ncbi:MAG TPA: ATP-binding cassette domain-containing protein, partial [Acidimicrobiales bacterium]|nr:ATP-binding cassette domain-containing protein [Acidimicrobiales bacterium]
MQGVVTGAPLLEARGLSVRYGPVTALDRVDLDLYPGQVVALAGENGAGKSTLVRCIAGDVVPDSGRVRVHGRAMSPDPRAAARLGVAVVWQDLALCENLDISANLWLGREGRRLMLSSTRFHEQAQVLLDQLQIRLPPTTTPVSSLSGGQRQLVAVARALISRPELLVLDEPTSSLGVAESARVEELAASLPALGTTILMVTHDLDQMFRMADRIVVLRRGRVVAEVRPFDSHPDEVVGLISGQAPDDSARRQLNRLHSLAGQLATAEPSTGLEVIMSALGGALGFERLCVHVQDGETLTLVGSVGVPADLSSALAELGTSPAGGQISRALLTRRPVTTDDVS